MAVSGAPGTGTITLGSAITDATNGDFQSFATVGYVDGETVRYIVIDGHNWAHESGTYNVSGTTITNRYNWSNSAGTAQGGTVLSLTSAAIVFVDATGSDLSPVSISQHANCGGA
jgi:hypothetical protein